MSNSNELFSCHSEKLEKSMAAPVTGPITVTQGP